jgi:hypothetical protein
MTIIKIKNGNDWNVVHYDTPASEDASGVVKIATEQEVKEGVVTNKVVTPKTLNSITSELPIDSEVIHKSTDEVISGNKTFKGNENGIGSIYLQSSNNQITTTQTNTKFGKINIIDSNNVNVGCLEVVRMIDGVEYYNSIRLQAYTSSGVVSQPLELRYYDNGKVVAYAPTPLQTDNKNEVVTASWVGDKLTDLLDNLASVAKSGSYNDLKDIPEIKSALNELTDVSLSTPTNKQALLYDATINQWVNHNVVLDNSWGTISGVLSNQTDLQNALNLKANDSDVVKTINNITPTSDGNVDIVVKDVFTISSLTIYNKIDELPSLSMDKSGTRYFSLNEGSLPLTLYEWSYNDNKWNKIVDVNDSQIFINTNDEKLYRYTPTSPYIIVCGGKTESIPLATNTSYGIVTTDNEYGIDLSDNGNIKIEKATNEEILSKTSIYKPIVPYNMDYAIKVSLTTNNISLTNDEQKTVKNWLGIGDSISRQETEELLNENKISIVYWDE